MTEGDGRRLDLWLWYAHFCKTRSLATRTCTASRIRLNGSPVRKPSQPVRCGDVITFAHRGKIRVVRIVALGVRRGPASEAVTLYEDLSGEDGVRSHDRVAGLLDLAKDGC